MTQIKKQYPGVDMLKFLMSIIVVSIHTLPLDYFTSPVIGSLYDFLCASAVPSFFIAAGYFLAQKVEHAGNGLADAVTGTLKKFVKLYVLWMLIYSPLAVGYVIRSGHGLLWGILYFLRGFFLLGELYNSWPLWYLMSAIYGLIFLYLLNRKNVSPDRMLLYSYILYQLGKALSFLLEHPAVLPGPLARLAGLLSNVIFPGRLTTGFLLISVGMLVFRRRFSSRTGAVLLLLDAALVLLDRDLLLTLGFPLHGLGLFILASNLTLGSSPIFPVLRRLSMVLYYLHMYVWNFYYWIVYREKTFSLDSFLVTTLVCIGLGLIHIRRKHRKT